MVNELNVSIMFLFDEWRIVAAAATAGAAKNLLINIHTHTSWHKDKHDGV